MATEVEVQSGVSQLKSLAGKVAMVTGASRGIGRAVALELANRGATVAINYNSSLSPAESLHSEINQSGGHSLLVQGDVSDKEKSRDVVKQVLAATKKIDILVNNAGITRDRSLRKMTDEDWEKVISTNLHGTYYCTSAVLPGMIAQKFGRIVNVASLVGQAGAFGQANYAASKGAIIAFTKVIALEMAKFNITANAVCPGYTMTDMFGAVPADVMEQIKAKIPLGRLATPEEVAKSVAFLVVDGDYITGQQLNINGGVYM